MSSPSPQRRVAELATPNSKKNARAIARCTSADPRRFTKADSRIESIRLDRALRYADKTARAAIKIHKQTLIARGRYERWFNPQAEGTDRNDTIATIRKTTATITGEIVPLSPSFRSFSSSAKPSEDEISRCHLVGDPKQGSNHVGQIIAI